MDKNDFVMIDLDRLRKLRLGYKALKKMSEMMGVSIADISMDNFDAKQMEIALFCMLTNDVQENGETLKLEQMEDLMDIPPVGEVTRKMGEAFQAAFGTPDGEADEKNA